MNETTETTANTPNTLFNLPTDTASILNQIKIEYNYAYQYMNPKRIQNLSRMRLYSNQTRDKQLVGDTTLFTIFNTVLSTLYEDELSADFAPGHPDDVSKVQFFSPIARYDYDKMAMSQIEYEWDWYACFWGSGFLDVSEFDTNKKILRPSVVDNATLLVDPDGTLINGDPRGFGAFRFWGREVAKTKDQMGKDGYKNYSGLTGNQNYSSLDYQDKQARRTAQNTAQAAQPTAYANELIPYLEWWTTINGDKWCIHVDLQFQEIIYAFKWNSDKWPLVQRKIFPIPGDPLGISIPDLVEDKQRARAVLLNLGLMDAKTNLYPMYVYDRNAISPTTDLSFGFNKWIPSDGPPGEAVKPLDKQALGQQVSYIMDLLDSAAQRATAATSMQQGVQSEKPRSANEVVRVFNQSEERLSTSARVFGWSAREFWKYWLDTYQRYFKKAHSKFVRIEGAFGPKFEKITGENFKLSEDPDIYIESKTLNQTKNQDEINRMGAFNNFVAQDQSVNRRYFNKRAARVILGFTTDEIDRLYPPTPDEMKAEDENNRLNADKVVKIDINDDHEAHLLIHANADDTRAAIVHIEAHKRAIMIKRQLNSLNPKNPQNPGEMPLGVRTQPNLPNTGSAPATTSSPAFSVQS